MPKRRWKFGSYELKYNPKSNNSGKSTSGEIRVTANGIVSSSNPYYEQEMQFTFDIYGKPTYFDNSIKTTAANYYTSISEDENTGNLTLLRKGFNSYDVITKAGVSVALGKSINLATGGVIASAIVRIDNQRLACIYPNGELIICGDNGVQISKYTYTDQEVKDCTSISWDNGNYLYLLNKFGKIFKVDKTNGTIEPQFAFGDFASNKLGNIPTYTSIHFNNMKYIGVVKGNKIIYLTLSYELIHSIEVENRGITSISYGMYNNSFFITTATTINAMYPNMSAIDVDKVEAQLAYGAVSLVDENNITRTMFVKQMSVRRIRNKQESRYEISLSGTII